MPYIKLDARSQWDKIIASLVDKVQSDSGKLKYLATTIALKIATPQCYANYERAAGFLTCLRFELLRRIPFISAAPEKFKSVPFDMDKESIAINTNLVHGITKEQQGGHLNYTMSVLFEHLISRSYFAPSDIDIILKDTIEDFYLEQVAPYEDIKIQENGDVYFQALRPWWERDNEEQSAV